MAEKAIRLGGESTAAAITQAVQELYPEHKFTEAEFARKDNAAEIAVDTNFAAQSFWKDVRIRFFRKRSAVLGLVMIMIILLLAIFGPGMNAYTYSGQDLSQKNFAPRVPGIEQFGILDGSEKMSTTPVPRSSTTMSKKARMTSTTGSAATSMAATSGPVHGKAPASPLSSPWRLPSLICSSA